MQCFIVVLLCFIYNVYFKKISKKYAAYECYRPILDTLSDIVHDHFTFRLLLPSFNAHLNVIFQTSNNLITLKYIA